MSSPTREWEVLRLVAANLPDKLIADALGIRECTVRTHLQSIYVKLGVPGKTAAMLWARERGLGPPRPPTAPPGESR